MAFTPHPDSAKRSVICGVITVSDTRTPETDRSGQLIQQLVVQSGHHVGSYTLIQDEPESIQALLLQLSQQPNLDALLLNGGTGIAPRDTTYDVVAALLEKTLPGFGELFRWLSYQEIGSRAIASRAIAGVLHHKPVFSMPGSTNAVRLAMEKLILPELQHLVTQVKA